MARVFKKLGVFIVDRRKIIIIVSLILIMVSIFGAMRLAIATDADTWVSRDSKIYQDYERFTTHFSSDIIVVMVTGENLSQLLQPNNLKAMEIVESRMAENPKVLSVTGPVFFIKQMMAQQTGTPTFLNNPQVLQAMVIDPQTGQIRPELNGVLPDDKHALIPITLKSTLSQDEKVDLAQEIQSEVDIAGFVDIEPDVTGTVALTSQVSDLISSAMRIMLAVAVVLMIIILALIFHVRGFFTWRWLALGIVGIGIIYTFGFMGLLGIPITMVSMAVFPVVIGLGIDYSINLHNRYDEGIMKRESPAHAVIDAVTHMGTALGIALIMECLGFSAIFLSPIPMVRDFGLMLIVGVIICYLGAIFFTMPILYWRDTYGIGRRKAAQKMKNESSKERIGLLDTGLAQVAAWVVRNPKIIIPVGLVLALVGFVANFHVETETQWTNLLSRDIAVVKSYQTLLEVTNGLCMTSVLVEADDITDPKVLSWMVKFEDFVSSQQQVMDAEASSVADLVLQANNGKIPGTSIEAKQCLAQLPTMLTCNLISADHKYTNIPIRFSSEDMSVQQQMRIEMANYANENPVGSYSAVTGAGVINNELFNSMSRGRTEITLIGIGIVFLGLFIVFRFSLNKAILSCLPLVLVIGWVAGVMYLAGIKYNPLTVCLGAMIMGMGVEYTILYMMRYYEERAEGKAPTTAMTTAMTKVGRAIVASGVTTIGGFSALLAAGGFILVRDFGFVTLLAVFFGLVSALVVHPPMVVLLDSWQEKRGLRKIRNISANG